MLCCSRIVSNLKFCVISCTHRAHESWELDEPPEYVTFAKKMLVGGFYHTKAGMPKQVCFVTCTCM